MRLTSTAVSLNVADVTASADFLREHLGFGVEMSFEDTMCSLTREDTDLHVVYLRTGLDSFRPTTIAGPAGTGTLLVLVVDDIDTEWERLRRAVPIATPIETEPWGERYFQMLDPNGIVIQLVQWVTPPPTA